MKTIRKFPSWLPRKMESMVFALFALLWTASLGGCQQNAEFGTATQPVPAPRDDIQTKYGIFTPTDTIKAKYGIIIPVDTFIARYGGPIPTDTMKPLYGISSVLKRPTKK